MNQSFWKSNRVFIVGVIMAVLTTVIELTSKNEADTPVNWWVLGWAAAIAALSYLGKNVRGQWASIITIIAATATSFVQLHDSPSDLTLRQFVIEFLLPLAGAIIGIFNTTPPKSVAYEHTPHIADAKAQAERIAASPGKPNPPSVNSTSNE